MQLFTRIRCLNRFTYIFLRLTLNSAWVGATVSHLSHLYKKDLHVAICFNNSKCPSRKDALYQVCVICPGG